MTDQQNLPSAERKLTVRDLREMCAHMDDDAPVVLTMRCTESPDHFHDFVQLTDAHGDVTFPPGFLVIGEVDCQGDDEHPEGHL